jgi:hypothetical protein
MHGGREGAKLHSLGACMVMLAVARTASAIGRPDLLRCMRCFNG